MVRASVPDVRIEIIPDTGHFPQLDESAKTNAVIERFVATVMEKR
jgi:pimeloyl-ACP methyl ester carboxylesterase